MDAALGNVGWAPVWDTTAQVGTSDYSQYAADIKSVDFDVIVLGLGGLDAVNALERSETSSRNRISSSDASREIRDRRRFLRAPLSTSEAWSRARGLSYISIDETFREDWQFDGVLEIGSPIGGSAHRVHACVEYAALELAGTSPDRRHRSAQGHEYDAGLGPQTLRARASASVSTG